MAKQQPHNTDRLTDSALSSFYLDRLFDPEQLYYTPMEELLKRYKKRNLIPGRVYNLAKKYGNVPESRERKIIAPQMERAGQRIFGNENFYYPPDKVYYCTRPNNQEELKKSYAIEAQFKREFENEDEEEDDDESTKTNNISDYKSWMKQRRRLRNHLNKLDLDVNYLRRKKNLTELERKVLNRLLYIDKEIQTEPILEKKGKRLQKSATPKIVYPTPAAMERIEAFLNENRWRLVDLFADLDKNKDWRVKKDDFVRECKKGRLDVDDAMIEELIMCLGTSKSNKIKYKALAKGRKSHLSDKRSQLRGTSSENQTSAESEDSSNESEPIKMGKNSASTGRSSRRSLISSSKSEHRTHSSTSISVEDLSPQLRDDDRRTASLSAHSWSSKDHPNNKQMLQLPPIDTRPERYPPSRTDRGVSASSSAGLKSTATIKKRPQDATSETQKSLQNLRQRYLVDYEKCVEQARNTDLNMSVTESTLKKGLLAPADKDRSAILKELANRQQQKIDQQKNELLLRKRSKKKNSFY